MNGFEHLKEKMDNVDPETGPNRVLLMGKMNEIQISSNEPKEGKALILQGAERNEAYFGKFKPRYFWSRFGNELEL